MLLRIIDLFFNRTSRTLERLYHIKANSDSEAAKHAADIKIKKIEAIEAGNSKAVEVRTSMKGLPEIRFLTFFIAFPFAFHSAAVILDSVFLFSWNIAALPSPYDEYQGTVLLWFFGIYTATSIASGVLSKIR